MSGEYRGEEVRGFLASDDLTTAAEVVLRGINYNAADSTPERVLVAGERLVIDSVVLGNGATDAVITLFQDQNDDGPVDAGEELISAALLGSTALSPNLHTPIVCRQVASGVGGKIKAKASAGSEGTRIFFTGRIINT